MTFVRVSMIKWLKSTKIAVHFHRILEGCVRLYYRCQGQRFERATKCIMHTSIWPSPMRSVKIKLPNISDCGIHQKALVQAFIQVFTLRCHFRKVKRGFFFFTTFCLCGCVSVSLYSQWWWEHTPRYDRGQKQSSIFQLMRSDGHFLSVVQKFCLPQCGLSFI